MNLQEKVEEIFGETSIICPKGEEVGRMIIIAVKSFEVVCWPFMCLICPETDCLLKKRFKN